MSIFIVASISTTILYSCFELVYSNSHIFCCNHMKQLSNQEIVFLLWIAVQRLLSVPIFYQTLNKNRALFFLFLENSLCETNNSYCSVYCA